jgi:hypothetical protein
VWYVDKEFCVLRFGFDRLPQGSNNQFITTYIQIAKMHTKLKLLSRVCACTWSEFHGILNNHKNRFLESWKMSTPN